MKHLFFIFTIFANAIYMHAQGFKQGSQWSYYLLVDNAENTYAGFTKYEIDGTCEMNGKTYNKLYSTRYLGNGQYSDREYVLGLRTENGKVYVCQDEYKNVGQGTDIYMPYQTTEDNEVILYDFTQKKGDFVGVTETWGEDAIEVANIENTTLFNGESRKKLMLFQGYWIDENTPDYTILIEGIGCINSLGQLINYINAIDIPTYRHMGACLNLYIEGNSVIYKAPQYSGDPTQEHLSYTTYKEDLFLRTSYPE
ncbi:hypothetical protein [Xylanibacter muris]|uniref:Uncharacterized protein n=1 Tax=Xylanibacter muris TaxID=2736290 RepID=A0ABX2AKP3_9BACT|nr:hypothetical protein [Xylanibacter muris]NPD90807.1 hypothetical protein [Xylanibacter muris]